MATVRRVTSVADSIVDVLFPVRNRALSDQELNAQFAEIRRDGADRHRAIEKVARRKRFLSVSEAEIAEIVEAEIRRKVSRRLTAHTSTS